MVNKNIPELKKRYSCIMNNPLLETSRPKLTDALALVAILGYSPTTFGKTAIGPNVIDNETPDRNIDFILLEHNNGGTAGLVKKVDLSTTDGAAAESLTGYAVYELRY